MKQAADEPGRLQPRRVRAARLRPVDEIPVCRSAHDEHPRARDPFGHGPAETARGIVAGFGIRSYLLGFDALLDLVADERRRASDAVSAHASPGGEGSPREATPGVLAIWNDRDDEIAELYESWYVTEHVPERLDVAGFRGARRYEAASGSPRFSPATTSSRSRCSRRPTTWRAWRSRPRSRAG